MKVKGRSATAVEILVEGFMDDPFFLWAAPTRDVRSALLQALFSLAVDAAKEKGFLVEDERGVSILVPPDRPLYDSAQDQTADRLIADAFEPPIALLKDYRRRLAEGDPDLPDAWYLHYLAVPADRRSRGNGTSLMADVLQTIGDSPLWLHTGRPSTLPFYAAFSLTPVASTPCTPHGPVVHTLVRSRSTV